MPKQHTIEDVYEVVGFIKDNAVTSGEFNELKSEVKQLGSEVKLLGSEVKHLRGEVNRLDIKIDGQETRLVTKEYLDEKLFNLKDDLVALHRKEETKLKTLVSILGSKKVISRAEQKRVLAPEPLSLAT